MDFPKPKLILPAAAAFARPADTTQYAAGDLVANSTTAGSVVPVRLLAAARVPGYRGFLRRARIRKSTTSVTTADFRVHFFNEGPPVLTNGDNAAFVLTSLFSGGIYMGAIDVNFTTSPQGVVTIGTAIEAVGFPTSNQGHLPIYTNNSADLWALIEARSAYTPGSAETFLISADADQY